MIEEILVVRGVTRVADHQADARPASGASAALGVVVRARGDVTENDRVQAADVDAHFHRGRAGQHVERGVGGRGFEAHSQVHPSVIGDLGGVFVRDQWVKGRLAQAAHGAVLFDLRVRPGCGGTVAAWTGCADWRASHWPGADSTAQAVGVGGQPETKCFRVQLGHSGAFTMAIHVRGGDERASFQKLEQRQTVIRGNSGRAETLQ